MHFGSFLRNLNEIYFHLESIFCTMRLTNLPNGAHATVTRVTGDALHTDGATLDRLGELGFIPGEPVQLLRRGPGGREPLAVMVGETMFALRWVEANCIEVATA